MNSFTITLEKTGKRPLYEQLYLHISKEIKEGRLRKGEKLPSKRALSNHLQISQNTVETAYGMLTQEGYIYARAKSGFYVCTAFGLVNPPAESGGEIEAAVSPPYRYDFKTNAVDISSFPYSTWARLSRAVLTENLLSIGDSQGDLCLRQSISKYLHEFRGVDCDPSRVVIGAGMEYLLMLLCQLLPAEASIAMEEPGYNKASALFQNSGRRLCRIPLDKEGMVPEMLRACGAQVAYITPSHQFPTGIIMPVGRRLTLIQWAEEKVGRYIIEDDYNSEFTFLGKPIPAAQGLGGGDTVIYMSTFSRSLAPSIRIAYMVLPPPLMETFHRQFSGYASTVSRFEQHTLHRFISDGHLSRHLNRVRSIYKKRKDALVSTLRKRPCAERLRIAGDRGGLHLLITMDEEAVLQVCENARREKIRIYKLSDYFSNPPEDNTVILGYGGLDNKEIEEAVPLLFSNLTP